MRTVSWLTWQMWRFWWGIVAMAICRFVLRPPTLSTRPSTKLDPAARWGISRDSAIVAGFIFLHNLSRLLGESFSVALNGGADSWQPFISSVAKFWVGTNETTLVVGGTCHVLAVHWRGGRLPALLSHIQNISIYFLHRSILR